MVCEIDIKVLDCRWFLKVRCPSPCDTQALCWQETPPKATHAFQRRSANLSGPRKKQQLHSQISEVFLFCKVKIGS